MTKLAMFAAAALLAAAPAVASADDESPGGGYLGVRLQRIEGGLAEALGMKPDSGVLLGQVIDDSPAAKAGLRSGDIVTKIGDTKVGTPAEFRDVIGDSSPGKSVAIEYLRDGEAHTADAVLGEAPAPSALGERPRLDRLRKHLRSVRDLRIGREHGWLGVYTQPLTGDLGEFFGAKDGGALVSEVVDESPAAKLGLRAGDVIVRIDDEKIGDPEDLRTVVAGYDEPTDVDIAWVRDHRERSGKAKLEMREGLAMLGAPDAPMPPEFDWTPGNGAPMRQRVHSLQMRAQDETERAIQELEKQVKKLEEQMRKLERKVH